MYTGIKYKRSIGSVFYKLKNGLKSHMIRAWPRLSRDYYYVRFASSCIYRIRVIAKRLTDVTLRV